MNNIWTIAKREINSYFDSLIAYLIIVIFLGLSGFFTWLFGQNIFFINQASLDVFFGIAYWTLFFFIPAITMRAIAEENKVGTLELLSTKPVSDLDIVLGKFLACLLLVVLALLCSLPYYFTVSFLGKVDHGAIIGGYFGLTLVSAVYVSIGVFASSTTNNQIVAFLTALFIGVFFHILFDVLAGSFTGGIGRVFDFLSVRSHFDSISRGVFDSRDLLYFASLILAGVVLSEAMISKRNWQR
jgi:ABC-2 type transport system permease protein